MNKMNDEEYKLVVDELLNRAVDIFKQREYLPKNKLEKLNKDDSLDFYLNIKFVEGDIVQILGAIRRGRLVKELIVK